MLTKGLYVALASMLEGGSVFPGALFLAVGRGAAGWDEATPEVDRGTAALVNEVARRPVEGDGVSFLDAGGEVSAEPTARVRIRTVFPPGEELGTLRECGLFAGEATVEGGSGTLLAYYVHPRLDKAADSSLTRSVIIDLAPRPYSPGTRVTRYLANVRSEEVHDLENTVAACQVEKIRFDHGAYLASIDQAREMGYDFCAYCFGPEMSEH